MKKNTKKDRYAAFTIIEVMIVLAIAGLIMVVVFIAVPQLQRNVRDHARKGIADRLKAEIETYAGNNQGKYPLGSNIHLGPSGSCPASTTGCITDFVNRYITGKVNVKDPSLGIDVITGTADNRGRPVEWGDAPAPNVASVIQKGDLYIFYGAKCNGENVAQSDSGSSSPITAGHTFAVVIGLDRDGTDYCIDNG
jgi:type II secretory pathway pseudopilin PulG